MNILTEEFKARLGEPTSESALLEYLHHIQSNTVCESDVEFYVENHHILPRSVFPDFEHASWNIAKLSYQHHVKAHYMLAVAYPIGLFLRPLNFMLSRSEKISSDYKQLLSESVKRWWVSFKKDPRFKEWRDKRAVAARRQMLDGHSKLMSDTRYSNPEARLILSKQVTSRWMDEGYREKIRQAMLEYHTSPGVKEMISERSKQMWANRSPEEAERIKQLLREQQKINNSKVAEINKQRWQEPEYRAKMKSRRTRGPDTGKMKEKWQDPIWREKMLEARRKAREAN